MRKTPAKTGLKAKKKKPASKRINLSGESSESERESRTKRSKSKMRWREAQTYDAELRELGGGGGNRQQSPLEESEWRSYQTAPPAILSQTASPAAPNRTRRSRQNVLGGLSVEVKGANMVENPTLSVDLWRRLTSKQHKSVIALADTGASKSVIDLALVKKYKLKLDTKKTCVSLTNMS